jgi:hypothetical protein
MRTGGSYVGADDFACTGVLESRGWIAVVEAFAQPEGLLSGPNGIREKAPSMAEDFFITV